MSIDNSKTPASSTPTVARRGRRPRSKTDPPRNGHQPTADRPWGDPREIPTAEVPAYLFKSKYIDLAEDILLRLEKTHSHLALEYPFLDAISLKSARESLGKYFARHWGSGYVKLFARRKPPTLYAHRGPNWQKPD